MRLFGFNISRAHTNSKALSGVDQSGRGWWPILESFTGAWQRNVEVKFDGVLSYHADFACRTLIASDISKLRIKLMKRDDSGVWSEVRRDPFTAVLNKPNHFQTRIQFMESWVLSKLQYGNAYILKHRDLHSQVVGLYVLDPSLVTPLVSEDGSVFYRLNTNNLAGLPQSVLVPAREIIHDRFNAFHHPLVGLSPIFAGGLAAMQGLAIQNDSARFFQNGARPSGILVAPGEISKDTADQLKQYWSTQFSGENAGKVAVVGDGLKYEALKQKANDAQLIEQLRWSAAVVCSVYHVPPYKAGIGDMPANTNIQSLNLEYYSQCLQVLIESIEICLDEGLGMSDDLGTELDTDNLLRMDTATQMEVLDKARSVMTLDERRKRLELPKLPTGGDTVYLQQQDHSIEAIAARDAQLIESGNVEPPVDNADPDISTVAVKMLFSGQRNPRKAV